MRLPLTGLSLGMMVLGLAGCAGFHTPTTPSPEGLVTGSATYRERIGLPPDAVVEVTLSDVSLQDAAAPVIAQATVRPEGRQVPIEFELRYDPQRIQPTRSYAVRASIQSAGRIMFTTDQTYRVITQGSPTRVELMLVRVTEAASPTSRLVGTAWRLEDLGGAVVVDRAQATLEFPQEGKATGSGSCNRFFGSVTIADPAIKFGLVGTTQMACPEPVAAQESQYLKALQDAERFTLEGSTLQIFSKGMDSPLRFVSVTP